MSWDNRVFDVNGRGQKMLAAAISLAFQQQNDDAMASATGYSVDRDVGITLHWLNDGHGVTGVVPFPSRMSADRCADVVWDWLQSKPDVSPGKGQDADIDHDGDNGAGWRVRLGEVHTAICAVRPVLLWYGK